MPNLWTPYFKNGIAFGSQKKFKQAEQAYRKGLEVYPDHPSLLANYGATLAVLGKIDKAETVLRAAIRQLPNNPSTYNSLAQVYLRQKKPEKARDMILLAVTVNPNFATGYANLAMLYAMMNQRSQANFYLGKALQLGLRNSVTENLHKILQSPLKKR